MPSYIIGKTFVKFCFLVGIGLAIGFFVGIKYERNNLSDFYLNYINPVRGSDKSYRFIKPLLAYKIPPANDQQEFRPLYDAAIAYVDRQKKNGNIDNLSLFFSELDRGRWIGINENEKYTPASLMKVILMMAYLKKTEKDSGILNRKIIYSKSMSDLTQTTSFDTPSNLQIGAHYTVDELLRRVIVDSDNGAKTLLLANIDDESLDGIFSALKLPNDQDSLYAVSPRDYSLFFRVLYSATYLNKQMSEKALNLLSQTTFNDGLRAGVPKDATVADKFGEHILNNGLEVIGLELHDCGIVYYQPSPYFICIMTKGNDPEKLKSAIKELSGLIYDKVTKN